MKLARLAARRAAAETKIATLCQELGRRYRLPNSVTQALSETVSPKEAAQIRQLRQAEAVAQFLEVLIEALEIKASPRRKGDSA